MTTWSTAGEAPTAASGISASSGREEPIIDWRFGDEMKPTIANAVRDAVAAQGG
jgi:hypothetical protein